MTLIILFYLVYSNLVFPLVGVNWGNDTCHSSSIHPLCYISALTILFKSSLSLWCYNSLWVDFPGFISSFYDQFFNFAARQFPESTVSIISLIGEKMLHGSPVSHLALKGPWSGLHQSCCLIFHCPLCGPYTQPLELYFMHFKSSVNTYWITKFHNFYSPDSGWCNLGTIEILSKYFN